MVQRYPSPNDRASLLMKRVDDLRDQLRSIDPSDLAHHTGSSFSETSPGAGEFRLTLWGKDIILSFPGLVASDGAHQELTPAFQALVIYYFHTSDGAAITERFIAFSELPEGRFYAQAFQGYTGEELRRAFGDDRERFELAAQKAGGYAYPHGDASYRFSLLPKVALLAVFWGGDEDFPAAYQLLFDAATSHHLPTDACAIAGSMLTRELIKNSR